MNTKYQFNPSSLLSRPGKQTKLNRHKSLACINQTFEKIDPMLCFSPVEEWIRGAMIGHGSTSFVSLAFATASGEVLAVKSSDLSGSAFLQKESRFLSKLSSPRIVEYRGYEIGEENGRRVDNLFMEYAPRGTLKDETRRRGGKLKESEIRGFMREILSGLEYIHGKGIAHCDIKMQNILITDRGLKVADFGCAKRVDEECAAVFSGTPAYMAPEVARQEEQGYAADVWSVGCMLIEMAMGSLPWMDADDPVSALYRIGHSVEVPEPPQWLTDPARDFARKCLIRDPKERPRVKELLKHQFLLETADEYEVTETSAISIDHRADADSPNCVLESRLWESMDSTTAPDRIMLGLSAVDRMEEMFMMYEFPAWVSDDGWISVRSHWDEETDDDSDDPPESVLSDGDFIFEDPLNIITTVTDRSLPIKDLIVLTDSHDSNCIDYEEWVKYRWCRKRLPPKVKMEVLIEWQTHRSSHSPIGIIINIFKDKVRVRETDPPVHQVSFPRLGV